ncbi:Ribosome maturation factor RimP [Bienertia sinuspersici]
MPLEYRVEEIRVDVTLISFSHNHICGDVAMDGIRRWRFVGIYGWPRQEDKCKTWNLIRHVCGDKGIPILIGGDFNEILAYDEKEGGADGFRKEINHFREAIEDCDLHDLGFWVNGILGKEATQWRLGSENGSIDTLLPLLGEERGRRKRRRKGFKFETCWLLDDSCEAAVREAWNSSTGRNVNENLAHVAHHLVKWSGGKFDKLGKQIETMEIALKVAQQKPISVESCEECANLERALDELNEKYEAYWYIRSRAAEVRDGDKNTKYFHHKDTQRRKRNYIKGLFDHSGNWHASEEEVERIISNYFEDIFTSTNPSHQNMQEVTKQHQGRKLTTRSRRYLLVKG